MSTSVEQDSWAGRKRQLPLQDGTVAFVEEAGIEPAVVLVHGFTDTSRSFSLLMPHLAGHRLLIPDLRNHGGSFGAEPDGLGCFASDLIALVMAKDLHRPVLVGHSLGAMVAIEACAAAPGLFGALVLIGCSLRPRIGDGHPVTAGLKALRDPIHPTDPFFDYWHHCREDVPKAFLEKTAQEASKMPAARWRSMLELIRRVDLTSRVHARGGIETVLVNGVQDTLFGSRDRAALVSALPEATVVDLPLTGHNPHWEEPSRVAAAICNCAKGKAGTLKSGQDVVKARISKPRRGAA
ncbi:alpha/beta fold hydrolase [Mesorhizobium sp. UC22_110]|uniref:alpha/beta fold hydrolase n=1 Tax=unclassified Mesorhizobium TaxID=325217 RepID=UPI003672BD33